jgi:hypothetical protein
MRQATQKLLDEVDAVPDQDREELVASADCLFVELDRQEQS